MLAGIALAAIGPTTAAELAAAGFAGALQPERATGAGLAEAIAEHLGPRK
ncbi:MAG TPA: uroporphyrinogen-III synthase [Anaeromyxobacteraceae bacterium]